MKESDCYRNFRSCRSAFSDAFTKNIPRCSQNCGRAINLLQEAVELINKIEEEVPKMLELCHFQKNVNMTIENRLENLNFSVKNVRKKHQEADKEEGNFHQKLVLSEKARHERKKTKESRRT